MPLCMANGRPLYFAHVPKTGGSSVEDYLIRRFGPMSLRTDLRQPRQRQPGVIQSLSHLAASDLPGLLPADTISFAVVRDPVARIKSEYRFQSNRSRTSRLHVSTWLRSMLAATRRDPRIYENHLRPQVDMVPEGAAVFRLEDGFEAMTRWLDEVTGTTAPELTVGHFLKRKSRPIPLSRQDLDLIARFYAADYDRFGYPPPDTADLPSDPRASLRDLAAGPLARMIVARHHRRWMWGS